ncbi:MAG: tetratricopeptide repeat protein, partial [Rhodospirillaceae bacterium]|nr:tetratricopeptide repeat protein [Rhodospirillaceae bacterium]
DMGGNTQAAEKNYDAVIKEAGLSLRLAQHFGGMLERSGKTTRALEIYTKYDAIDEGYGTLDAAKKRMKSGIKPKPEINTPARGAAEALFGLASSLSGQGATESAMVLAQLALYLRPDFPAAISVVGGILESYQRYDDANNVYKKIPRTSIMYRQAKLRIAANLERLEQVDAAIKMLKEISAENKSDSLALVELGDVLRRAERFKDAATAYSQALGRISKIENHHWGIFYSRGISFERSNNWEKAEDDFLTALKMEPDQPFVLNYLGYSWIEKKLNLEKAISMIQKAVDLRPRDGYIVDSLGWGLYHLGDFTTAVKKLERAVLLRPEDPIINDHLGDALWQVGRLREARFQWERALTLEPEEKDIEKIKEKLKSGLNAAAQ